MDWAGNISEFRDPAFLGASYVPFTFPTVTVRKYIAKTFGKAWTAGRVNDFWNAYKGAIQDEKLPPYSSAQASKATVDAIMNRTKGTRQEAIIFCETMKDLSSQGKISTDWYTAKPGVLKKLKEAAGETGKEIKGKLNILFIAGVGLALVIGYQFLKKKMK